jgi:hypothetical protein
MGARHGVFQEASGVRQQPNLNRRPGERRDHTLRRLWLGKSVDASSDNSFLCVRRDDAGCQILPLTSSHHGQVPDISV